MPVVKAEPFSILARLPDHLPTGRYELFAHPGKGGPAAWGGPLAVEVKTPARWPEAVYKFRDFGARGDDVADDTKAVRDALAAAEANGGGVVDFPWGTYRLSDWLLVPARTVLRGEVRDATVLKWPLDPPKDEKDFLKAAVLIGPECGLEDLTLTGRRVETILLDVESELNSARSVPAEAARRIRPWGRGGDIFLGRLLVHHLLLAGRPEQQKPAMENPALNKRSWDGQRNALIQDGRNLEVSDLRRRAIDDLDGGLYGVLAPETNPGGPAGEWNDLEIDCRGPRLRVTMNGRLVQDIDQDDIPALRDRPRAGYLMLQNHGSNVEFRDLRLKDLAQGRK